MAAEQNVALLIKAIRNKLVVTAIYEGYSRVMCPYAIGTKNGILKGLFYQYDGEHTAELPAAGQWLCLVLEDLSDLSAGNGFWCMPRNRPQTCIDNIIQELES